MALIQKQTANVGQLRRTSYQNPISMVLFAASPARPRPCKMGERTRGNIERRRRERRLMSLGSSV